MSPKARLASRMLMAERMAGALVHHQAHHRVPQQGDQQDGDDGDEEEHLQGQADALHVVLGTGGRRRPAAEGEVLRGAFGHVAVRSGMPVRKVQKPRDEDAEGSVGFPRVHRGHVS
ncbi:hypothetical protein AAFF_G00259910 [Aldrovandia affinis]|uniref:Uncharacterized protein n=1 Tax=Aldrovandia affinis TaxID=143900 RepID=A0AAD7W2Q2_9TELE|nr:hypothetical protein AAFF_G00259910 [Aldrovandia affinis]